MDSSICVAVMTALPREGGREGGREWCEGHYST